MDPSQTDSPQEPLAPGIGLGVDHGLLETILDTLPNPVIYKDVEGRILGCNLAFEAAMNLRREDLVGRQATELLLEGEAASMRQKDEEVLAKGGILVYPWSVTIPGHGLRQVIVYKAPFKRPDGSVLGIVSSILDFTEQKEAEEALLRSEQLFTTITEHVVDLMAIIDAEGRRLFCSPSYETVLGYSREAMASTASLGLLHPEDHDRVERTFLALFQGGAPPQGLEYRLRHKEGRWLTFEANCALITQSSAPVAQILVVARDVTARKLEERERQQMEKQLQQAQRLESIGSLAAGIAHEINTPTQYIGDNATFLRDSLGDVLAFLAGQRDLLERLSAPGSLADPELQAEVVRSRERFRDLDLEYLAEELPRAAQQALEGVGQVSRIVGAMKDFSHPGEASKSPTQINRSIESTLAVSRNEWKYVAEVELDLDPELPAVPCYQGELNQALLNLVVNAAHAIAERIGKQGADGLGHIRVSTRQAGDEVEVAVADDGAGIPDAIRGRIFDPFFTTKAVGKGTGQGLAIVHAVVVERHGGRVTLESEVGRGSTFHVWLPLATMNPRGAESAPEGA